MAQSLACIYVHIVFSTKNRAPFLKNDDIRTQMHAYLSSVCKAYDSVSLITGGTEDHVHILCSVSKNFPISKIIGEIKRNSSKWIKKKGAEYSEFQWQNGYGAFSVSSSNLESVRRYIIDQKHHHKKYTFKEELIRLLKKHGVEFNEKYLWE